MSRLLIKTFPESIGDGWKKQQSERLRSYAKKEKEKEEREKRLIWWRKKGEDTTVSESINRGRNRPEMLLLLFCVSGDGPTDSI